MDWNGSIHKTFAIPRREEQGDPPFSEETASLRESQSAHRCHEYTWCQHSWDSHASIAHSSASWSNSRGHDTGHVWQGQSWHSKGDGQAHRDTSSESQLSYPPESQHRELQQLKHEIQKLTEAFNSLTAAVNSSTKGVEEAKQVEPEECIQSGASSAERYDGATPSSSISETETDCSWHGIGINKAPYHGLTTNEEKELWDWVNSLQHTLCKNNQQVAMDIYDRLEILWRNTNVKIRSCRSKANRFSEVLCRCETSSGIIRYDNSVTDEGKTEALNQLCKFLKIRVPTDDGHRAL